MRMCENMNLRGGGGGVCCFLSKESIGIRGRVGGCNHQPGKIWAKVEEKWQVAEAVAQLSVEKLDEDWRLKWKHIWITFSFLSVVHPAPPPPQLWTRKFSSQGNSHSVKWKHLENCGIFEFFVANLMNILNEFRPYSSIYLSFQYKNSMGNKLGNEI